MKGKIERYLVEEIKEKGIIHFTLIDPVKTTLKESVKIAKNADKAGSTAIMIGGSLGVEQTILDQTIKKIKENCKKPIILFPGGVSGLSKHADAIWFMSLLNSTNPYFIIHAQMSAAPIIKSFKIEPIPLAYIIFEPGEAAGYMGMAHPIPRKKPEIAAAYALAAQYLGIRFLYLEAGSGASQTVPEKAVKLIRKTVNIPIIVGGGIKTEQDFRKLAKAGADAIVTGTLGEEKINENKLAKYIKIAQLTAKTTKNKTNHSKL